MTERDDRGYLIMPAEMLESAGDLMMKSGVRSVSMDDISRHLGISKKTLYQYVSNKGELIGKIMTMKVERLEVDLNAVMNEAPNSIVGLINHSKYMSDNYGWMSPKTMHNLKKYYPTGWQILADHMEVYSLNRFKNNLQEGIDQGLIRPTINIGVMAGIFLHVMLELFNERIIALGDINTQEAVAEFLEYHLRGITTQKGQVLLESAL